MAPSFACRSPISTPGQSSGLGQVQVSATPAQVVAWLGPVGVAVVGEVFGGFTQVRRGGGRGVRAQLGLGLLHVEGADTRSTVEVVQGVARWSIGVERGGQRV